MHNRFQQFLINTISTFLQIKVKRLPQSTQSVHIHPSLNITIRTARHDDLDWMQELSAEGMRDAHFVMQPIEEARKMFVQVIDHGLIRRITTASPSRLRLGGRKAEILLSWLDVIEKEGQAVGFIFCTQRCEGSKDIEMYQLSVNRQYRKQGLATLLVDYVIKQHKSGINFYARCYPKSTHAFSLFLSMGFKHINTQSPGTRELYRGMDTDYIKNEASSTVD
ncbi:N-acetyltransferase family protein [Glaciimonas sp. GG7]